MNSNKITLNQLSPLLSGVAGEYYVAAALSARGYIASITLRNTKGVDILCSNDDASRQVAIQVKTNRSSARSWVLSQKSEDYFASNHFYVFVNLNDGNSPPDYFIVPSKDVSTYCKEDHEKWRSTPGRHGQAHNETPMRKFNDKNEQYLNRWELLGFE